MKLGIRRSDCDEETNGSDVELLNISAIGPKKRGHTAYGFLHGIERDPGHTGQGDSEGPPGQILLRGGFPFGQKGWVYRGRGVWKGSHYVPFGTGIQRTLERSIDVRAGRRECWIPNWRRGDRF